MGEVHKGVGRRRLGGPLSTRGARCSGGGGGRGMVSVRLVCAREAGKREGERGADGHFEGEGGKGEGERRTRRVSVGERECPPLLFFFPSSLSAHGAPRPSGTQPAPAHPRTGSHAPSPCHAGLGLPVAVHALAPPPTPQTQKKKMADAGAHNAAAAAVGVGVGVGRAAPRAGWCPGRRCRGGRGVEKKKGRERFFCSGGGAPCVKQFFYI